jgi:hypothetical protein
VFDRRWKENPQGASAYPTRSQVPAGVLFKKRRDPPVDAITAIRLVHELRADASRATTTIRTDETRTRLAEFPHSVAKLRNSTEERTDIVDTNTEEIWTTRCRSLSGFITDLSINRVI